MGGTRETMFAAQREKVMSLLRVGPLNEVELMRARCIPYNLLARRKQRDMLERLETEGRVRRVRDLKVVKGKVVLSDWEAC